MTLYTEQIDVVEELATLSLFSLKMHTKNCDVILDVRIIYL